MIDERERVFRQRRIDSLDALRSAHSVGQVPELPVADVVLVLDGYGQLAGDFEEFEPLVHSIAARGGSYGVHLVASVARWGEVRMAQQAAFGTRVELRLNDPADSTIDRKLAATIKDDVPGRALLDGKLLGHVALPRIDSSPDRASAGEALGQAVRAVRSAWTGSGAPQVRVLPPVLAAAELPDPADVPFGVPLGLEESDLKPEILDLFGRDQHLLVLGDGGCGKTNLLRLLAQGLTQRHSADELVFAVVDPRRGLRYAFAEDYLGGYATNAASAAQLAAAVTSELAKRSPDEPGQAGGGGPALGAWPHVVLLVDDYDVLVASGTQPLAAFVAYLSAARDIDLHVVLTRRVSGASRGLYEPLVMGLREAGAAGLVMSGDRSEGLLFSGVRASHLPPGRGLLVRAGEPVRTVQTAHYAGRSRHAGHGRRGVRTGAPVTEDVIALCRRRPEIEQSVGALLAAGPELWVRPIVRGELVELVDDAGFSLLTVECPLLVRVPGEVRRLLGEVEDAEAPLWWVEIRAASAREGAAGAARRFAEHLVRDLGGRSGRRRRAKCPGERESPRPGQARRAAPRGGHPHRHRGDHPARAARRTAHPLALGRRPALRQGVAAATGAHSRLQPADDSAGGPAPQRGRAMGGPGR